MELSKQEMELILLSYFLTSDKKKLLLQNVSIIYQGVQYWFCKQEIELSKQEMELFFLLPDLWSNNFFYKMFLNFINEFKACFENRKWNYPNRKWNYFSYFLTSDRKNFYYKMFLLPTSP